MRQELKAKMRGLLIDLNFNKKGLIREVRLLYGADAVLFILELLFSLAQEPGAKMRRASMVTIGKENNLKVEVSETIIDKLVTASSPWLFKDKDGYLFSDRIQDEQNRYLRRCKINKRNRATNRPRIVERSDDDCIDIDHDIDNDLNKEEIAFQPFGHLEADSALRDWLDYRKQIKKKLAPKSIDAIVGKYFSRPDVFVAAVKHSISNGWQGLFENGTSNGSQPRKAQNVINEERSLDTMNKILSGEIK